MARDPKREFSYQTKLRALDRQKYLCASCGDPILPFDGSLVSVAWGECAHAHHLTYMREHGGGNVENCVILCSSCHYNAHEGGRYRRREGEVVALVSDFPHFYGTKIRE